MCSRWQSWIMEDKYFLDYCNARNNRFMLLFTSPVFVVFCLGLFQEAHLIMKNSIKIMSIFIGL